MKKNKILIDYIAQKSLINRFVINNVDFNNMKIYTVDEFQEKEFLMIILNIIDNDCFDFFFNFKRLLFIVSRARNDLIIVYN